MSKATTWCDGLIPSMTVCAALAHAGAAAQDAPHASINLVPEAGRDSPARVTLEGFVLAPGGSPAEGAVVVSSAGGRAVTDVAGNYRLVVEVPFDAASVQVTAVGRTGTNLVASARVALSGATSTSRVDPLALSLGSGCPSSWIPTFGEQPGTDGNYIRALAVYDDGGGPALYVGGNFSSAGSTAASRIAKWDGSSWTTLGSGIGGVVRALAVYDDGSGPALYAGGGFGSAGGVPANRIAKWDGSSWTALGSGMGGGGNVLALQVFDDGSGPALYAGGGFRVAGGVLANGIARWDGSSWTTFGSGMGSNGVVQSLAVHDDGDGPALYAGGNFSSAGGVPASRIAKWNGSTWSALGSGMDLPVLALVAFDDGSGTALYAGGSFTSAGGVAANRIARWDGSTWTALGAGMDDDVTCLAVHDDGGGTALYAGGNFTSADGAAASRIARWDGSSWAALGIGMDALVRGLGSYDDGDGPALYAGGEFSSAGVFASKIAKWDGSAWSALGSRLGVNHQVWALAVHDDGGGPALYAGGLFSGASGLAVNRIAKWDGSTWSPLSSGVSNPFSSSSVRVLASHDDGTGPALYAGGTFASAGGIPVSNIAKWDGSSWASIGGVVNLAIMALATYDDGAGPALYAGGNSSAAGTYIAKWDGSSWSALGSGMGGTEPWVFALAVHDDGSGPALYAGGQFSSAGGVHVSRIARWNGSSWSALGGGGFVGANSWVNALAAHDDCGGPALYAGGYFTSVGGVAAKWIAKWDGSTWSALGSGVSGSNPPGVMALIVHDDGGGPALYAGGTFTVTDSDDSFVAKWGCSDSIPPVISCPPAIFAHDRLLDGQEDVSFTVTATDNNCPAPVVVCMPPSGSTFPLGTTLVTCTATDASGNQSTCQFPVNVSLKVRRR